MAKLKKISYTLCGKRQEAEMKVSSSGEFSIAAPAAVKEALEIREVSNVLAKECEKEFHALIERYEAFAENVEKVIALRVRAKISHEAKTRYNLHGTMHRETPTLNVEVGIVNRHTISSNGKDIVKFEDLDELDTMHGDCPHPIPSEFRVGAREVSWTLYGPFTFILWTQEAEDRLLDLLRPLQYIVDALRGMACSADNLLETLAGGFKMLGAPPPKIEQED